MNEKTIQNKVLQKVIQERGKQNQKWGQQNHKDAIWLVILTEEVGETSQAILHDIFGGHASGNVEEELIQVAAVAIQWLECIQRKKISWEVENR